MSLLNLVYYLLVAPAIWLTSTLLTHALLVLTLTTLWRAYKTVLVRQVSFLRRRHLRPVEARQAVLITGAGSGIGLALTKHLYKAGYSVVATYLDQRDVGYEELRQLQQQQQNQAGAKRLLMCQLDVTKQDQVRQVREWLAGELKQRKLELYALVNNAGLGSLQPFAWLQRRNFTRIIDTNITGGLLMTREFLPQLIRSKGRLVFVSSGLAFIPGATYATYGITKAAQIYFSGCLNMELKSRYGVQSVAVVPHNFIKNTNICAQNIKVNQQAWDELTPGERELYAREYEQQLEMSRSLDRAIKEQAKVSAGAKAQQQQRQRGQSAARGALSMALQFVREIVASFQGENLASSLEESGALECFEDALRLRDPPEVIFAGDTKYQLLMGSILVSLPHYCLGLLSGSVAPNLYR